MTGSQTQTQSVTVSGRVNNWSWKQNKIGVIPFYLVRNPAVPYCKADSVVLGCAVFAVFTNSSIISLLGGLDFEGALNFRQAFGRVTGDWKRRLIWSAKTYTKNQTPHIAVSCPRDLACWNVVGT